MKREDLSTAEQLQAALEIAIQYASRYETLAKNEIGHWAVIALEVWLRDVRLEHGLSPDSEAANFSAEQTALHRLYRDQSSVRFPKRSDY